jgi:hypothetical protein
VLHRETGRVQPHPSVRTSHKFVAQLRQAA